MERDEILKAAQKGKQPRKEYEDRQSVRGDLLCMVVAALIGVVLFLLQYFIAHTVNLGFLALAAAACATQNLFEGIKLKKIVRIIVGAVLAVVTIVLIVVFIVKLV